MTRNASGTLEDRLRAHYRATYQAAPTAAEKEALVSAMLAEACAEQARTASETRAEQAGQAGQAAPRTHAPAAAPEPSFPSFVAAQARFIRPWVWAVQALLALVIVISCLGDAVEARAVLAASIVSAMMVLVGVPDLLASKSHGMAELELASRFGFRSVLIARMIVLGCSEILLLSLAATALPALAGTSAFTALVNVAAPYLLACAGCLTAIRRSPDDSAIALSTAWTAFVLGALIAFRTLAPAPYDAFANGFWIAVALASGAWCLREANRLLADAASGLDRITRSRIPSMRA